MVNAMNCRRDNGVGASVGAICKEWRKKMRASEYSAHTCIACNPFLSHLPVVTAVTAQRN